MIHDLLLSCLNLNAERLPILEFIESGATCKFLHPCETKILQEIIEIINVLRDIAKFTKIHGSNISPALQKPASESDELIQNGLYIKAFANGIDIVLQEYYDEVTELERRYLQNPKQSLLFIYVQLQEFESLAYYLRKLIHGIRTRKLHGCAIMQYLHQNNQHGDERISRALKNIITSVNVVFLNQLTHWILYAKLIDNYGEFFIQCVDARDKSTMESERGTSTGSERHTNTTFSDIGSTYTDIWRYEICQEYLPHHFTASWSEKVLFIGQTVLIFKVDISKNTKKTELWWQNDFEKDVVDGGGQKLWNDREHVYFGKLQALQENDCLDVWHYERVIDEIKSFVTARLSELAVNEADLENQLRLIKDFYLLGRGELFLEFIRTTCAINKKMDHTQKLREYVKAFESAAHGVGISEQLEKFTLSMTMPTTSEESASNQALNLAASADSIGEFSLIQLQYKINWPLHLIFSPRVIDRYNVLFRYLLLIKRLQFQLHSTWCTQTRTAKIRATKLPEMAHHDVKVMHLRNQLMFFLDNLQYYIQVDVLESQFSILLNVVQNKADFEQIQRAHSVFQANVLALSFLLTDEDAKGDSDDHISLSRNPVHLVINEILHICDEFYAALESNEDKVQTKMDDMTLKFDTSIDRLMSLLSTYQKTPSCTTPLMQLLLRLDFNHWFSNKKKPNPV